MRPSEGVIQRGDITSHYLDWHGSGPPLVLIHATGFLAALWRPIAEELSDSFHVVAIDQRGHGDSPPSPDGYTFEAFADDLQALIETLELERPVVAGHSSGGTTAVAHAARHPDDVRGAVLIDPVLAPPELHVNPPNAPNASTLADRARKRRTVWSSADEAFESYRTRPAFSGWREDVLRLYVDEGTRDRDDGQVELKCAAEAEAGFYEAALCFDAQAVMAGVRCPALVIWGADDGWVKLGADRFVEEAIPHGRTVIVSETGHYPPQECPGVVARLIDEFLVE